MKNIEELRKPDCKGIPQRATTRRNDELGWYINCSCGVEIMALTQKGVEVDFMAHLNESRSH
jgi:hypothetical protein